MTLLYMFGLAAGSLVAYGLEKVLNPIVEHPCGFLDHYSPHTRIVYEMINSTMEPILSTTHSSTIRVATTTTTVSTISTTLISYLLSTLNSTELN